MLMRVYIGLVLGLGFRVSGNLRLTQWVASVMLSGFGVQI